MIMICNKRFLFIAAATFLGVTAIRVRLKSGLFMRFTLIIYVYFSKTGSQTKSHF